jgi:hypothetical protein
MYYVALLLFAGKDLTDPRRKKLHKIRITNLIGKDHLQCHTCVYYAFSYLYFRGFWFLSSNDIIDSFIKTGKKLFEKSKANFLRDVS